MKHFSGYHGTSYESSEKILQSNYELSLGDNEWLGSGVYFFLDGFSSVPKEQAKKWAIAQAWDNNERKYDYTWDGVLKSVIAVSDENLLDLTIEEGVEVL